MSSEKNQPLIQITNLTKIFKLEAGLFASAHKTVAALKGVNLTLNKGETYGLVGESGSGKTTLARTLIHLEEPTAGLVEFLPSDIKDSHSKEFLKISFKEKANLKRLRREVRYVFQDPASSLDPRMTVRSLLTMGLHDQRVRKNPQALASLLSETLSAVGLSTADLNRRPLEFSGGQRQRIALARALITKPAALICDEVVSALDVSIQGQILNLLVELKQRYQLTILFIAHDLTVVSYLSDRVGVMYGGLLMEEAPAENLIREPLHPYTKLLYASIPRIGEALPPLSEEGPSEVLVHGCPFVSRCPLAEEHCRLEVPLMRDVAPEHRLACHRV